MEEPKWIKFLAGGLASSTAELCTIPIDTIKVRLQLQGQAGTGVASAPKLGLFQMVGSIFKNEGLSGFYKGITPAVLRQMSYSSIRVGIYEPIRNFYTPSGNQPTYLQKVLAGGTSGAVGIMFANPTELVKVRMQADKQGTRYTGTLQAFTHIVKNEGIVGLWQGVIPNMQRAFIVNAMELGTYDHAKQILVQDMQFKNDSVATHGIASFIAGFFATVACNPVDVIKNRLMSQKADQKLYSGMIDCAVKTVRAEGFIGLYKGFFPQWMRLGPWCMVMFISFEQYRKLLKS